MITTIQTPPTILRSMPNWVVWNLWNPVGSDKPIKVPFDPHTGKGAKTNNPATWGTFEEASNRLARYPHRYMGLGFIFSDGSGIFGVDCDGCLDNAGLSPWAQKILDRFQTYAEVSPSGSGIKLYGIGEVPPNVRMKVKVKGDPVDGKKPGLEIYGRWRFFCYTGQQIGLHREVHECSRPLQSLLKKIQPPENKIEFERNNTGGGERSAEYARRWLTKHGPAISGNFGHTHTYTAALTLVDGFGLDQGTALELLREWNQTCSPPWSERDLIRKIQQASKR